MKHFARWHPPDPKHASVANVSKPPGGANGSNFVPIADDSLPPSPQTLRTALDTLVSTLNERSIRYAIIGAIAVAYHGRPRSTDDIDALLAVPQIAMPGLFEALRQRGFTIDLDRNICELRDDGLTTIYLADVTVDLMRPVIPAYLHVLDRAIATEIRGQPIRMSSAEGLIVTKLASMRPQDEADIRDVLTAYAGKLDLEFVRTELDSFTDAGDPRRAKFEAWVREFGSMT